MAEDDRLPRPAPALEGKANRAVIALVAEHLGVPSSSVTIRSGATSSQKRVLVTGIGKEDLLSGSIDHGRSFSLVGYRAKTLLRKKPKRLWINICKPVKFTTEP